MRWNVFTQQKQKQRCKIDYEMQVSNQIYQISNIKYRYRLQMENFISKEGTTFRPYPRALAGCAYATRMRERTDAVSIYR